MKKYFFLFLISFFIFHFSFSQDVEVYPSNWWVGMKWNKVQLMVYGKDIGNYYRVLCKYPGVKITVANKVDNPNYLFINLEISKEAKPGKFVIDCGTVDMFRHVPFELKPRRSG
ncbi:MAG TPA: cyclomaltodextrinase N-terminal domain-containing protein, partial [Chitinophagaceae bacterium]|nr:cyclomaltodextrinase N-terminal domain-containing protein [Chitinophagaceae bacterium]